MPPSACSRSAPAPATRPRSSPRSASKCSRSSASANCCAPRASASAQLGLNIRSKHDDGRIGWPEHAPFDAIIVTAAAPALVEALTDQLAPGGTLVAPVGGAVVAVAAARCARTPTAWSTQTDLAPVVFVPLLSGMVDDMRPGIDEDCSVRSTSARSRWARHPRAPALPRRPELRRGDHLPGAAGSDAGADVRWRSRKRAFWFATLSLAGSMVGAVVGYALGHYALEAVKPLFDALGWMRRHRAQVDAAAAKMAESPWTAFWLLVLAGFTPIPMKFFTWASGIVGVPMLPFLASMLIGRGKRVYLVAAARSASAASAPKRALRRYIEPIGWVRWRCCVGAGGLAGRGRRSCGMNARMTDAARGDIASAALALARRRCCAAVRQRSRVHPRAGASRRAPRVSTPKYGATAVVKRGDTLYRIAFRNGIAVRDLAPWNGIAAPYMIHPGQRLRLYPRAARDRRIRPSRPSPSRPRPPRTRPRPATPRPPTPTRRAAGAAPPHRRRRPPAPIAWRWPADGRSDRPLRRRRTDQAGHRHRRQRRRSPCARRAMASSCIPARAWSAMAS